MVRVVVSSRTAWTLKMEESNSSINVFKYSPIHTASYLRRIENFEKVMLQWRVRRVWTTNSRKSFRIKQLQQYTWHASELPGSDTVKCPSLSHQNIIINFENLCQLSNGIPFKNNCINVIIHQIAIRQIDKDSMVQHTERIQKHKMLAYTAKWICVFGYVGSDLVMILKRVLH